MIIFWLIISVLLIFFGLIVIVGSPYVPTLKKDLKVAFEELYKLSKRDHLVDLGSGDGVVLRAASMYGARSTGYELNPILVLISIMLSRGKKSINTRLKNLRQVKLPEDTTIVYIFANTKDISYLTNLFNKEALRLGKELYIVSYGAQFPHLHRVKKIDPYFLYKTDTLHVIKPQV